MPPKLRDSQSFGGWHFRVEYEQRASFLQCSLPDHRFKPALNALRQNLAWGSDDETREAQTSKDRLAGYGLPSRERAAGCLQHVGGTQDALRVRHSKLCSGRIEIHQLVEESLAAEGVKEPAHRVAHLGMHGRYWRQCLRQT